MKTIALAIGFMLIFEGVMPLVAPALWKRMLASLSMTEDAAVRRTAFALVSFGLAFVWMIMELM